MRWIEELNRLLTGLTRHGAVENVESVLRERAAVHASLVALEARMAGRRVYEEPAAA